MKAKTFAELQEQTKTLNLETEQLLALARTMKIEVPHEFKLNRVLAAGVTIKQSERRDRLFFVIPSLPYGDGGVSRETWVELSIAGHVMGLLQHGVEGLAGGDVAVPEGFDVEVTADGEITYAKSKK